MSIGQNGPQYLKSASLGMIWDVLCNLNLLGRTVSTSVCRIGYIWDWTLPSLHIRQVTCTRHPCSLGALF